MRFGLRNTFDVLATLLVASGLPLLLWPQDFLVLIGAGFAGSGSAAAILLLILGGLLLIAPPSARRYPGGWMPRRGRLLGLALVPIASAVTLYNENSGFSSRDLRYQSGSVPLVGTLIVPNSTARKRPGLVIVHGSIDQPRRVLRRLSVALAKRTGAVVLYFDKRGFGESGGTYIPNGEATPENLDKRADDLAASIAALAAQSEVDAARVGVLGVSQAGWVVPIAATKTKLLSFALLISGPTLSVGQEGYFSRMIEVGDDHFGWKAPPVPLDVGEEKTALQPSSGFEPLPFLEQLRIPSMWLFGEWDNSGPVKLYAKRVQQLKARGLPFETYTFPEGNHGLYVSRGPHRGVLPHLAAGAWDSIGTWLSRQAGTSGVRP